MQKLAKKCISKNIIKILKIYQKDFEKSIKERTEHNGRNG